jgi:hypothetical protein
MKSMFKGAFGVLVVVLALSGMTAASALAAGTPVVETKHAIEIKGTEADLTGKVEPNGAETKFYFEYGPTITYGTKTKEQTTTTLKEPVKLVTGLTTNTTYHFRLVATNSYGTSYGSDEVFATPTEKPELVLAAGEKYSHFEISATGGGTVLQWGAQKSIECTSSAFYGSFINSKELEGNIRWYECFANGRQSECLNEKTSKEGYINSWIQSEKLKGTLGYINKAKKEVGLRFEGKSSEIFANNVKCPGGTEPLTASLGGQLGLAVNAKIPTTKEFSIEYKEIEDKQTTGELGGQLLWPNSSWPFGIQGSLKAKANKEFEIQA